jgi:molybdate transport system substrate-binding protein
MRKIILTAIIAIASVSLYAQTVKVAAAANLRFVMEEIKKQYEVETSLLVDITFGSSGTLTQQILNGAAIDLFFAADVDFPKKIADAGFASGEVKTYIYGKLALWSLTQDVSKGLKIVTQKGIHKIAIADPKKAPYGESAVELLKKQGLYNKIADKIVWGDNISQAAQFAFSGNAELGFIALSLALAPDMQSKGKYYVFPADICPPLEQACVLIKGANPDAKKFLDYVMNEKCAALWVKYGYELVK